MTLFQLAYKDIARSEFRSWVVFLAAALVAGLVVAAGLLSGGTAKSLGATRDRLGADLLVVPRGQEALVEDALLMGTTATVWMPRDNLSLVRRVRGVSVASPQIYLASLAGASCCSVSSMFIVAFDPASDFTVQPWLDERLAAPLSATDAVGGAHVSVPQGEEGLRIYGSSLDLVGTLEPTGSNLDSSLFLTFEAASRVAGTSKTAAEEPLVIPDQSISSILVRVDEDADPGAVAAAISHEVPGTSVVLAPQMFDSFRSDIEGLSRGLTLVVAMTTVLSLALVGVVFSMAAHERRREVGVWRALGATRSVVVGTFVAQAAVLSLAGGVTGAALAVLVVTQFKNALVAGIGAPLALPTPAGLLGQAAGGVLAAFAVAILAAMVPAMRASRQDPAQAMRE